MGRFLDLALLIFGFQAATTWAQAEEIVEDLPNPKSSPNLEVTASASFPAAEIFGIKLVNGRPTQAVIEFDNREPESVYVAFVGGSLWTPEFDPQGPRILRNLTSVQYGLEVPAGEKSSLQFNFVTEMHPQELRLNLAAIVADVQNRFYTIPAFNGTVSVVEPDTSIFDPQIIFLYFFLLACFGGTVYFFYTIWIAPYFAPKRGRGGDRPRKPKKDAATPVEAGADSEVATSATGSRAYNEEWIPAHHIQRPEARRVKSGTPRPKSRGKAE